MGHCHLIISVLALEKIRGNRADGRTDRQQTVALRFRLWTHAASVMTLTAGAGLPVQTGVHRDAGSAGRDDRRFLADVVGAQLDHRGYVDQTARARSGQYLGHLYRIRMRFGYPKVRIDAATSCTTGWTIGWSNGKMFVYTMQPVSNRFSQQVVQPAASCIQTSSRLYNRLDNGS